MIKKILSKYKSLSIGVKAGLWFTFCNMLQKGISFIVMPIFTRIMPQADYGLYSTYISWYNFLMIFTSLRLSYYVFSKGMVKYEQDRDEFVLSLQSLSTVSTLVVFLAYLAIRNTANVFLGLTTVIMVCMFIHMLFEPSIEYWTARKRFEYDYKKVVIVTIGIAIANPLLGILMVLGSNDAVFARVLSTTISISLFGAVLYFIIIRKGKRFFSTKYWKYALGFNLPLIPHFLASTALSQADRVMITKLVGPESTALYSVAYSLGMVTILFSNAIQQAILPWQYTKIKNEKYENLPEVANATMLIIAAINIAFIAFAPEVVAIVAPKSYSEAIWAMPPVCGSVFFMYLFNIFANIEYYFEETKYVAVASIAAALANILLNWIFVPVFGYVAAGYTTLFCYILLAICHYVCMKVICKKHNFLATVYDLKTIVFISIGMLIILMALIFVYNNIVARYAIIILVCTTLYIIRNRLKTLVGIIKTKDTTE